MRRNRPPQNATTSSPPFQILHMHHSAYLSQLGGVAIMQTNVTPDARGRVLVNSDMGEGLGLHEFGNDED